MELVMNIWEDNITGGVNEDNTKEVEATESFNKKFTELYLDATKETRQTLMELLADIETLVHCECMGNYRIGYSDGQKNGCKYRLLV